MKTRAARDRLFTALLVCVMPLATQAAEEIKAGKWQFTTEMQIPAMVQSSPGATAPSAGNSPMTRTACIDPAHPIPEEAQCKLDNIQRRDGNVVWSMTCSSPQGPVQSTGSAHYAGETMSASLTARVPGPNGKPVDAPGRITGRYIGPCGAK